MTALHKLKLTLMFLLSHFSGMNMGRTIQLRIFDCQNLQHFILLEQSIKIYIPRTFKNNPKGLDLILKIF